MAAVGTDNATARVASLALGSSAGRAPPHVEAVSAQTMQQAVLAVTVALRVPGIDGLRALAVGAVLLFHADLAMAGGGFLGVDLFFVVSGFLITRLLLADLDACGRIDYRHFYSRRARRLLPALAVVVACSALLASVFARDALPSLRADALPTLLFFLNWHYIAADLSYFEAIGRQPLLQHCWSLAIEEQFYLLWPLLVWLVARRGRTELGVFAIFAAIASALWMGLQAQRAGFPESLATARVYFGTDTHAVGLLAGAALAAWLRPTNRTSAATAGGALLATMLAVVGIGGLVALFVLVQENTSWLYPFGFVAAALCGVLAIVACALPGNALLPLLEWAPLRWLGERSYGVYLWHWPIYLLTRPGVDHDLDPTATLALRLVITLVAAELSYRFVEAPLLGRRAGWQPPAAFGGGVLAAFVLVGAFTLLTAPSLTTRAPTIVAAAPTKPAVVSRSTVSSPRAAAAVQVAEGLTVVGDSVVLGARDAIERGIAGARVFAQVGWQAKDVTSMLERLRASGDLAPNVMVHLGTNGHIGESRLHAMMAALTDRRLVLIVNSRVPRRWMADNNALLARVVPAYRNARLVNWQAVADTHREFFESDGVHLTPSGARAFLGLVVSEAGFDGGHGVAVASAVATDSTPTSAAVPATASATALSGNSAESVDDFAPGLVRHIRPVAPDSYWDAIARCQTGSRWRRPGAYAGGLALDRTTWRRFGGTAYAPTADRASRDQQISVANRIASLGHSAANGARIDATGFGRWVCARHVPEPRWRLFEPEALLAASFTVGQRGRAVRELQWLIDVPADGVYSSRTAHAHRAAVAARAARAQSAADATLASSAASAATAATTALGAASDDAVSAARSVEPGAAAPLPLDAPSSAATP